MRPKSVDATSTVRDATSKYGWGTRGRSGRSSKRPWRKGSGLTARGLLDPTACRKAGSCGRPTLMTKPPVYVAFSRCECQASLGAELTEDRLTMNGTAFLLGKRENAPAHSM